MSEVRTIDNSVLNIQIWVNITKHKSQLGQFTNSKWNFMLFSYELPPRVYLDTEKIKLKKKLKIKRTIFFHFLSCIWLVRKKIYILCHSHFLKKISCIFCEKIIIKGVSHVILFSHIFFRIKQVKIRQKNRQSHWKKKRQRMPEPIPNSNNPDPVRPTTTGPTAHPTKSRLARGPTIPDPSGPQTPTQPCELPRRWVAGAANATQKEKLKKKKQTGETSKAAPATAATTTQHPPALLKAK